ncbi:uncharacterized protein LOC128552399, partial [Mercenaria mercenaria]|uniref:uncharacterized protein LOC128552399 n=1 Tax=Mercenaria mercenaria TaxID=6596 RepID=UPI00234ED400
MSDTVRASLFRDVEKHIVENLPGKKRKSFSSLFKARCPDDLKKFHECCDGKGPTLTILHGRYNTLYGGYTSQDWNIDKKRFKSDDKAFLFFKNTKVGSKCNIIPVSTEWKDKAITCDANFGPTFGVSEFLRPRYDFQAFTLSGKAPSEMKDGFLHLNGSLNIGKAYSDKDKQIRNTDINGGTMEVRMLEVFEVVDGTLDEPWRAMPDDDAVKELKEHLVNFEPPFLNTPFYNILLLGVIGSGKSSFFNTLATVFAEEIRSPAIAADEPTSVTNE